MAMNLHGMMSNTSGPTPGTFYSNFKKAGEDAQTKRLEKRKAMLEAMKLAADMGQEMSPEFLKQLSKDYATGNFILDGAFPANDIINSVKDAYAKQSQAAQEKMQQESLMRRTAEMDNLKKMIESYDGDPNDLGKYIIENAGPQVGAQIVQKHGGALNQMYSDVTTKRQSEAIQRFTPLINSTEDLEKFRPQITDQVALKALEGHAKNKERAAIQSVMQGPLGDMSSFFDMKTGKINPDAEKNMDQYASVIVENSGLAVTPERIRMVTDTVKQLGQIKAVGQQRAVDTNDGLVTAKAEARSGEKLNGLEYQLRLDNIGLQNRMTIENMSKHYQKLFEESGRIPTYEKVMSDVKSMVGKGMDESDAELGRIAIGKGKFANNVLEFKSQYVVPDAASNATKISEIISKSEDKSPKGIAEALSRSGIKVMSRGDAASTATRSLIIQNGIPTRDLNRYFNAFIGGEGSSSPNSFHIMGAKIAEVDTDISRIGADPALDKDKVRAKMEFVKSDFSMFEAEMQGLKRAIRDGYKFDLPNEEQNNSAVRDERIRMIDAMLDDYRNQIIKSDAKIRDSWGEAPQKNSPTSPNAQPQPSSQNPSSNRTWSGASAPGGPSSQITRGGSVPSTNFSYGGKDVPASSIYGDRVPIAPMAGAYAYDILTAPSQIAWTKDENGNLIRRYEKEGMFPTMSGVADSYVRGEYNK